MNSLSFIHSGSSANVMVFLETGLDFFAGVSESSSARREGGTCRWRRGADKVMMEVERKRSESTNRNARQLSEDYEGN
jgi:hypothetical protein